MAADFAVSSREACVYSHASRFWARSLAPWEDALRPRRNTERRREPKFRIREAPQLPRSPHGARVFARQSALAPKKSGTKSSRSLCARSRAARPATNARAGSTPPSAATGAPSSFRRALGAPCADPCSHAKNSPSAGRPRRCTTSVALRPARPRSSPSRTEMAWATGPFAAEKPRAEPGPNFLFGVFWIRSA